MDPVNPEIIAVPDLEVPMVFDGPKEMAMREEIHKRIQADIYNFFNTFIFVKIVYNMFILSL